MGNYFKFLGTAGARFVVAKQLRASGGVFLNLDGKKIILDPGPGTIVRCAKSKPPIDITKVDTLILTHAHIDHSTDINILIDAITSGGLEKKGKLFAPVECLEGENAVILKYLRPFLNEITILKENEQYKINNLKFSTSIRHIHPAETYGITFHVGSKRISFLVDTKYFPELIESYKNIDILIMNLVRLNPHKNPQVMHLSYLDAKNLLKEIKPTRAILTHFGMTVLKAKPWILAQRLSSETGVDVSAASDGMTVLIDKKPSRVSQPTLFDFNIKKS